MFDEQIAPDSEAPPRKRLKRITAKLGNNQTVTITGADNSIDELIEILEELLGRAKQARKLGFSLRTFESALKDQAE